MKHPGLVSVEAYLGLLCEREALPEIRNFFHLSAAMIVGDRKIVLAEPADVDVVYSGLNSKFRTEGVARIEWDDQATSVLQIYPSLALVKVTLTRMKADRVPVRTWVCSYLMRECAGIWRCDVVTATPN